MLFTFIVTFATEGSWKKQLQSYRENKKQEVYCPGETYETLMLETPP